MKFIVERKDFAYTPERAAFYDYVASLDSMPLSRSLAERVGVSSSTINQWRRELGVRSGREARAEQIMRAAIHALESVDQITEVGLMERIGAKPLNLARRVKRRRPDLAKKFKKRGHGKIRTKQPAEIDESDVQRRMEEGWEWDDEYRASLRGAPGFHFGGDYWKTYREIWSRKKDRYEAREYGATADHISEINLDESILKLIRDYDEHAVYYEQCEYRRRHASRLNSKRKRRRHNPAGRDDLPSRNRLSHNERGGARR